MNAYALSARHLTLFPRVTRVRREHGDHAHARADLSSCTFERAAGWRVFFLGMVILALLVAATAVYIRQITTSAVGGYDVVSLERRVEELKAQERQLEVEAAALQSLKSLGAQVGRLRLVPTRDVQYASPLSPGLVARSSGGSTP